MSNPIDQPVPQNIEAEQALLGSLLMDSEAAGKVRAMVEPGDCYKPRHAQLLAAIYVVADSREPVDWTTVTSRLQAEGSYDDIGGSAYLMELASAVPTAVHVEHYAALVKRASVRRRLITTAGHLAGAAYDETLSPEDAIHRTLMELAGVDRGFDEMRVCRTPDVLAECGRILETLQSGRPSGIKTGFNFDFVTGGLCGGDLVIVSAYTGMGKSAMLQSLDRKLRRNGYLGRLDSAEMTLEQLVKREWAALIGREWLEIERDALNGDRTTIADMGRTMMLLAESSPVIGLKAGMRTTDIRATALREKAAGQRQEYLLVDYLQRLDDPPASRNSLRYQDIGCMCKALKTLAVELGIPVVLAVQVGRKAAERPWPHVPELDDLRESHDIAQEADVVLALNRPAAWPDKPKDNPPLASEAWLYVLKNRHGKTSYDSSVGKQALVWDGARTSYDNPE